MDKLDDKYTQIKQLELLPIACGRENVYIHLGKLVLRIQAEHPRYIQER